MLHHTVVADVSLVQAAPAFQVKFFNRCIQGKCELCAGHSH
jgi:hypothetical protein